MPLAELALTSTLMVPVVALTLAVKARFTLDTCTVRRTSVNESVLVWMRAMTRCCSFVSLLVFQLIGLPALAVPCPMSRVSTYQLTPGYW